ncbi:MAG: DUF3168 domain-containing protein [Chloroflexota bacterium]
MSSVMVALVTKLKADSTLMALVTNVFDGIAPDSATYPFLVIDRVGAAGDEYTLTRRVRTSYLFIIKVISEGYSVLVAETALARVDILLTDSTLDVTSQTTIYMRRQRSYQLDEVAANGRVFKHRGYEWQVEQREDA